MINLKCSRSLELKIELNKTRLKILITAMQSTNKSIWYRIGTFFDGGDIGFRNTK